MYFLQQLYYFSAGIFYSIAIIAILWAVLELVSAWWYEMILHKLYREKRKEITDAQSNGQLDKRQTKERIDQIERENDPEIKEIERKRRFILEKIPFINM